MGTISTLAADASYETLADEIAYPLVRCEARPLTTGLAPALAALLTDVATTQSDERKLVLAVLRAEILAVLADEEIDATVDAVVNNLLIITGGDREHELYTHFLGDKTPGELKEPILAEELETVRAWVDSLIKSPYPSLAALGPILDQQVANADKVVAALTAASQALKSFREVGPRRALVDKINANRKATYGALGEIAHSNPQLNLPKDFADRFFLHDQRRRRKPTSKDLRIRLEAARALVDDIEAKLAKAETDEKADADAKAQRKAKAQQKKVAAAEKKAAAAAAELAALKHS
jgi:hypothetical protein